MKAHYIYRTESGIFTGRTSFSQAPPNVADIPDGHSVYSQDAPFDPYSKQLDLAALTARRAAIDSAQAAIDAAQTDGGLAVAKAAMEAALALSPLIDYRPPSPLDTEAKTYAWDESARRHVGTPTLLANKVSRSAPIAAQIDAAEAKQMRALRSIAIAAPEAPAQSDVDALLAIEAQIAPLRALIRQINACATQADLDLIP